MISVVILNFKRPHNVETLVETIRSYPEIDDILVAHGREDTYREFAGCTNLTQFDENEEFGGARRFFVARRCRHDAVLFLDDDTVPSAGLVRRLHRAYRRDPIGLYGPIVRRCDSGGYQTKGFASYNIVLTPCLLTSKRVVGADVDGFGTYEAFLRRTHGNGEDLSLNHFLWTRWRKRPTRVGSPKDLRQLDTVTGAYSNKPAHWSQRNEFCQTYHFNTPASRTPSEAIVRGGADRELARPFARGTSSGRRAKSGSAPSLAIVACAVAAGVVVAAIVMGPMVWRRRGERGEVADATAA